MRLPLTLAVYALDGPRRGQDISRSRNPTAKLIGVTPAPGPDGRPDGSMQFYGRSSSYVELPNTGRLDARYSITILAWVYHEGRAGPIFNYNPRGFGVHLWMVRPRELFARFVQRSGRSTQPVRSRGLKYKAWNYVGTTYDGKTGKATLWLNSRPIASQKIGRVRLSTNLPVRIGARQGDRRYLKGRVFCVQVYSVALNAKQIEEAKKKCFLAGRLNISIHLIDMFYYLSYLSYLLSYWPSYGDECFGRNFINVKLMVWTINRSRHHELWIS